MTRARALALAAVAVLLVAARAPLHRATFPLPVSNDDAIPLLIAERILHGELSTVLWNQPYNGTLDSYLLAPGLLLAAPHTAFRLYEAACALLLVAAAGRLAAYLGGEGAGWSAAALAAVGTPYMALMAATGPTPNFLVPLLVAAVLLLAIPIPSKPSDTIAEENPRPAIPSPSERGARTPWLCRWFGATASEHPVGGEGWRAALAGLISGLAVWDSALALPALAGALAGLLASGLRVRPRAAALFGAGAVLGASPLLAARILGASGASAVTALRPRWLWADGVADLARAATGLFGLEVPLVVDGAERASLPVPLRVALGLGLLVLIASGAATRRALPFAGWALLLAGAFAFSRRTGGDEVRYLYGVGLPALVLAGAGLARIASARRAAAVVLVLAVAVPWLFGHRVLAERWRDPSHAAKVWEVPPLEPVLETLERARVGSAYASLQFAGRLTLESGGRVLASQAWNERIPGDPLRFRDEVDLDPRPAWVLSPHLSRGMPRAGGMREILRGLGGRWHEDLPGDFVVFRAFEPPYDESRPVPAEALSVTTLDGRTLGPAVLDRDPHTTWTGSHGISRGSGLAVHVRPARRVAALVLAVDLDRSPLPVSWICEAEGAIAARGPARHGLQWVNGAPRAGKQALLAIALGDRAAADLRLIFQGAGPPLRLSEVFVYGPDEAAGPRAAAESDAPAERAFAAARRGEWDEAVRLYGEAVRREGDRASLHAAWARARWRAAHRRRVDVESLDDGGPELVVPAR